MNKHASEEKNNVFPPPVQVVKTKPQVKFKFVQMTGNKHILDKDKGVISLENRLLG